MERLLVFYLGMFQASPSDCHRLSSSAVASSLRKRIHSGSKRGATIDGGRSSLQCCTIYTHIHTLAKKQHVHIQTDRQASHQVQYREQTVCEFSSAGVFNLSIQIGLMDRLFDIIIII